MRLTAKDRLRRANRKPKTVSLKRKSTLGKKTPKGSRASLIAAIKAQGRRLKAAFQRKSKTLTVIRGPKPVSSSWVDEIAYVRYGNRNGVAVKFLNGVEVFYPNTTTSDYEYLRDAASKGKSIHRRFYELDYELLN